MAHSLSSLFAPRIGQSIVFAGPSGSGKTELTINLALSLVGAGPSRVMVCDLDVVKPYFRLRDLMRLVSPEQARRLEIVEPPARLLHADIPVFPARLHALLSDPEAIKVIDVGGDAVGAGTLAQFRGTIVARGYGLYVVINTLRPGMRDATSILKVLDNIVQGTGLQLTGLVANTNLQGETTASDVQQGFDIIQSAGMVRQVPVVAVVASHEYAEGLERQLTADARERLAVIDVFNRILDTVGSQVRF
jgi:hypothetical protein